MAALFCVVFDSDEQSDLVNVRLARSLQCPLSLELPYTFLLSRSVLPQASEPGGQHVVL